MNELKHDCRVIAPCLRGTGYSSYHKPISTLKELAYDIRLFVKEYIKNEKDIFIIGHSTGAAIAI